MVFCNTKSKQSNSSRTVTILILIDGFLQYVYETGGNIQKRCHNPYFNRWFSAMPIKVNMELYHYMSQSLF